MGLALNPCREILLGSWKECVLVFYKEVTDYDIMLRMTKLKCTPAAKLIAMQVMK